jgi:outer membrane protein assembly factor BamB
MNLRFITFLIAALPISCFADLTIIPQQKKENTFKTNQTPKFDTQGNLIFEDQQFILLDENEAKKLSTKQLTVKATVRVDKPEKWGGIVGYSQDNGSYERGWLLGYSHNRFVFKLATGKKLIAATAKKPFILGQTYHLVATFNGKEISLFINGQPAAYAKTTGTINLPDIPTPFVIGAYKDKNEFFPMQGRVESVSISSDIATPAEIKKAARANQFQFAVRPSVSFLVAGQALVEWESTHSGPSMIRFGTSPDLGEVIQSQSKTTHHRVILKNLKPSTVYHYRIGVNYKGKQLLAPTMTFDTTMNYLPPEIPSLPKLSAKSNAKNQVDQIVQQYGKHTAGHALILGGTDAKLAYELARRTNLKVTIIDRDANRVAQLRETLYPTGVYGSRIEVILAPSDTIPLNSCIANFILSERSLAGEKLPYPVSEFKRLTRPAGGKIITRQLHFTRPALPDSDEWTHQYANSENRAYTNDSLAGADTQNDFTLQWIGRPGADFGIDRQNRIPSPLAVNGRTFLQGLNRMIALDSYNGQILWSQEIPDLRRMNVPHDCSNWCADKNNIYLAIADRAWIIDAASGKRTANLKLTTQQRDSHDWGYLAVSDKTIIGSTVPKGAQFKDFWGKDKWYDKVGDKSAITQICSDKIFAYDKKNYQGLWAYGKGLIVNSTITLSNDRLYFLENRHPDLRTDGAGQVHSNKLWFKAFIVCLNANTGKKIWESPLPSFKYVTETSGFIQAVHGQKSDVGFLLVASEGIFNKNGKFSGKGHFVAHQFDKRGKIQWTVNSPWQSNNHGTHIAHPIVFPHQVFLHPFAYNIKNGKKINTRVPNISGCPTPVGYPSGLIFRSAANGTSRILCLWSIENKKNTGWERLRPSCWLNYLPAQGMIIMTEGGGGCSCGGWIETSVSFIPVRYTQ